MSRNEPELTTNRSPQILSHTAKKSIGALVPSNVKKTPPPVIIWERPGYLLKSRINVLALVGMPKPPMCAAISDAAPVWIKAMLLPNELVGSVCSDETMSRNRMTTRTELFAFGFRKQIWGKTRSDGVKDPPLLRRESMLYGSHSRVNDRNGSVLTFDTRSLYCL